MWQTITNDYYESFNMWHIHSYGNSPKSLKHLCVINAFQNWESSSCNFNITKKVLSLLEKVDQSLQTL